MRGRQTNRWRPAMWNLGSEEKSAWLRLKAKRCIRRKSFIYITSTVSTFKSIANTINRGRLTSWWSSIWYFCDRSGSLSQLVIKYVSLSKNKYKINTKNTMNTMKLGEHLPVFRMYTIPQCIPQSIPRVLTNLVWYVLSFKTGMGATWNLVQRVCYCHQKLPLA